MNLRHILTIINIASLLKSSHAGFIEVGQGTCEAPNGHPYDYAGSYEGQTNNITAASDWCLSAVNYTSGLVGINLSPSWEYWTCLYDNGSIDNIQKQISNLMQSLPQKMMSVPIAMDVELLWEPMVTLLIPAIRVRYALN
jgi:hypothetical protein